MTPSQADLWRGTAAVCEGRVGKQSIWAVLYHQGDRLFADELFARLPQFVVTRLREFVG
jgi:hypothetical protein